MQTDHNIWINIYDERSGSTIRMELDDAVKRITARELPENFELEAVKALAIAIRTTIVKRLKIFGGVGCEGHKGADICTNMKGCSEIVDLKLLKEAIGEGFDLLYNFACSAVDETRGLITTCGGRPISAEYHMTCGGGTENSEDVLGNSIMYFRKVLCNYCANSPHWENTVDIPISELENKLKVKALKGNGIMGPKIEGIVDEVERDETGRVRRLRVGGKHFTGNEIKELLGLSSSRFGWDPIVIRFKVRGSGDGLGMCLYGANSMAKEGKGFAEILKYYYTNINIESIEIAGGEIPLKGKVFIIDPGHGGDDGDDEKGSTGLREKDANLYIAQKLAALLEKSGAKVILTRTGDTNIPLPARIEMVNSIRPNFLISIHQNSFFARSVSGTEVYYYRGDSEGERMSRLILQNIVKALGTTNRGNKYADLYILRESKVSSVVIECMYISNPEEEGKLKEDDIKDEIAMSIHRAIMDYYGI